MPLAALLRIGGFADSEWATAPTVQAENVALVGLRSVDDSERAVLVVSDLSVFTMSEIDNCGLTSVVEDALTVVTELAASALGKQVL